MAQILKESKIHKVLLRVKNLVHKPESEKRKLRPEMQKQINGDFLEAIRNNRLDECKRLLKAGADIESIGWAGQTALISAAQSGHIQICAFLLAECAKSGKDAKKFINETDLLKMTALHWAAGGGHTQICEFLLEHGASIDARDKNGETPLMWTISFGKTKTTGKFLGAYLVRDKLLGKEEAGAFFSSFDACTAQ
ncbi:MAG: ankyrin repeat domain-containing protein [Candidatus Micrarchaeota archaeon]|nr:ankyrin repeat domain-containing protein [Candidatus Micrarchaeota archaeon]